MNATDIKNIFRESGETALLDANVLREYDIPDGHLYIVELHFVPGLPGDDIMTIPVIHYGENDWLFTPWDWQEGGIENITPDTIEDIKWRVDTTETEAIMFNGLPMLAPWTPDPSEIKRQTRQHLGNVLREARESQGLSIRALAEKCNINKSQICRVEAGRLNVGIDTLTTIAHALGLHIDIHQDSFNYID